jgi:hypothetical protein
VDRWEANLQATKLAYDARGKDELDGLVAAFHPDAVVTLVGDKKALVFTAIVTWARPFVGSLRPERFNKHS